MANARGKVGSSAVLTFSPTGGAMRHQTAQRQVLPPPDDPQIAVVTPVPEH